MKEMYRKEFLKYIDKIIFFVKINSNSKYLYKAKAMKRNSINYFYEQKVTGG